MIAGRLDERISLLCPSTSEKGTLAAATFSEKGQIWAERVKDTAHDGEAAYEFFAGMLVEFNVRWGCRATTAWRVKDSLGIEYNIDNIIKNRRRGMLTLRCSRVNS